MPELCITQYVVPVLKIIFPAYTLYKVNIMCTTFREQGTLCHHREA